MFCAPTISCVRALLVLFVSRVSLAASQHAMLQGYALTTYESWSLLWYAVSALTTAVTMIIVAVAAVFAYRQIREAARARQLQSTLEITEYVGRQDHRCARDLVRSEEFCNGLAACVTPGWSEKTVDEFLTKVSSEQVTWKTFRSWLASLEIIAILVLHDLAPDEVVELYFGHTVERHWRDLQPLIKSLRAHFRGESFLQHLEMLNRFIDEEGFDLPQRKRSQLKRRIIHEQRIARKHQNG